MVHIFISRKHLRANNIKKSHYFSLSQLIFQLYELRLGLIWAHSSLAARRQIKLVKRANEIRSEEQEAPLSAIHLPRVLTF